MSTRSRDVVNRAPKQLVSVLAGLALSLALVKWGITRRIQGEKTTR